MLEPFKKWLWFAPKPRLFKGSQAGTAEEAATTSGKAGPGTSPKHLRIYRTQWPEPIFWDTWKSQQFYREVPLADGIWSQKPHRVRGLATLCCFLQVATVGSFPSILYPFSYFSGNPTSPEHQPFSAKSILHFAWWNQLQLPCLHPIPFRQARAEVLRTLQRLLESCWPLLEDGHRCSDENGKFIRNWGFHQGKMMVNDVS